MPVGVLSGRGNEIDPMPILFKSLTLQGIYVGSRKMFEVMNHKINQHKIKPIIDQVFPFTEAKEAYPHLKSAAQFGKIVIQVN